MKVYDRMVFVLHDIPDEKTRDAAAFLTLSAVWQQLRKVPAERKKALVLDEAWAFMQKDPSTGKMYFPLAVRYIPEIARTGRRHNLLFVIATQLVSDFFGVGDKGGPGAGSGGALRDEVLAEAGPEVGSRHAQGQVRAQRRRKGTPS